MKQFDGQVVDLKPQVFERYLELFSALKSQLRKNLETDKDSKVHQDLEILLQSLCDERRSEDISRRHLIPFYTMLKNLFRNFSALLDPRNGVS
ncbi:MAG: hypothetical protein ACJAUG_002181 [Halioglobus sp.]|jgi:hypothetical protein